MGGGRRRTPPGGLLVGGHRRIALPDFRSQGALRAGEPVARRLLGTGMAGGGSGGPGYAGGTGLLGSGLARRGRWVATQPGERVGGGRLAGRRGVERGCPRGVGFGPGRPLPAPEAGPSEIHLGNSLLLLPPRHRVCGLK